MFSPFLIGLIRAYRVLVAPHIGPCCRFTPSCSMYAIDAIRLHGPFKGLLLGIRRLLRCRPFGPSGFDPVPHPSIQPAHSPELSRENHEIPEFPSPDFHRNTL